jgi:hypothetical protein
MDCRVKPGNDEMRSRSRKRIIEENPDLQSLAVEAMIDARAWDAVGWMLDRFGVGAAVHVFNWLENAKSNVLDVPDAVYTMLGSRAWNWTNLLAADAIGPISLKLLSAVLDSRSQFARSVSHAKLLAAANLPLDLADKRRGLHSAVFFLSVGLRSWEATGAALVAAGFSRVYDAARDNNLESVLWDQLEPNLAWYRPSWDRCAQLVRTVAPRFKDRSWPPEYFLSTFCTKEQLTRAVQEIDQMWGGARFLRRLKELAQGGQLAAPPEQINLFSSLV